MVMNIKQILIILFLGSNSILIQAQKSLIHKLPDEDYEKAMELFEKQKYSAANHYFNKVMNNPATEHTSFRANAEYYSALCALELFNPDAEFLLTSFITTNPENNKVNEATFNLGKHHYNNKRYKQAAGCFEKVEASQLTEDQNSEYHFEAGYSYFMIKENEKARLHFRDIMDKDTRYTPAAIYYYSHIAYEQKNYETALEGFLRLRDDETFSPIVPYYITQIYFMQKKYSKVIEYATPLLDSVIEKRVGEMARMVGESHYRLEKYNDALPYLEKYASKTNSLSNEDKYELAYAYYKAGDMKNAIRYFEPVSYGNSELAQNALYHLANCYLKVKDKQKARLAFSSAANMDFNAEIKENALFNYAIATYEQSLSPFNEAVKAFNEYLRLYPYSKRADEANNYLALAFLTTRNYKAALEALDKIKKPDNSIRKAYQRVAFYRGLELYNNLKFDDAIVMLDKSLENAQFDMILATRAYYWKAESYYRLKSYNEAISLYNTFLGSTGAAGLDEFELAHYNIGYCYFDIKNYDEAMSWFKKYTGLMKDARNKLVADAYNRIGDCYFMKSSYWVAIENYEKAVSLNATDADYAMFQKGFALGLVNRPEKKIATLSELLKIYPKSRYCDDAIFELGRAYVSMNSNTKAIEAFNRMLKEYPESNYAPKSLLQLGLIHYNMDKNQDAIMYYKQVAEKYQGTSDARNAMSGLKTVYIDMNDVDSYFNYLEKAGGSSDIRVSEQDSLSYTAAENVYMSGDCDKSVQQLQRYIERFPKGNFLINANFYIADCNLRNNRPDEALQRFEYVLSASRSMFTGQSLAAAAKLYYAKKDYPKALETFKRLESEGEIKTNLQDAKIGQMRCYYNLKDYNNAITAAKEVIGSEAVQDEIKRESHYILAKSYLEMQNIAPAIGELSIVAKDVKSAEGAECKYLLAKTQYEQNKKEVAEKEIFDFIKKSTPYQYWLGKSFILLSDIYVDKNDEFQAVQTLQSIIDYYEIPNDGIVDEAKKKKEVITSKNAGLQDKKDSDIELNLNNQKLQ
jgi:TolA-binding protein